MVQNPKIKVVNIQTFLTHIPFGSEEYYNYDLREPKRKIINPDKIKETKKTVVNTTDWSNIPHYPTNREKRENVAKYLMKMGRAIPPELLKQLDEDKRKEIEEDSFNNFNRQSDEDNSKSSYNKVSYNQLQQSHITPPKPPIYQPLIQNGHISKIPIHMQKPPPNKFSLQYAAHIGAKPRAQASARIRLGGAF